MSRVMLRPDLKTAGGEVCDIIFRDRFVGTLTMVYRESDRVAGSLQLEQEVLSEKDKEEVLDDVHDYVYAFLDAVRAEECEIMVTYSSYDHVIAKERTAAVSREDWRTADGEFDYDTDWMDNDERLEDDDAIHREEYILGDYELAIVGENEDTVEYHVYDKDDRWVAEAMVHLEDRDVSGTVNWLIEPEEDELDIVAELIVGDFDEDQIDTFTIQMIRGNEVIETIDLTHRDLYEEDEEDEDMVAAAEYEKRNDYSVILVRDDGDVLTYEIYQRSRGGLPIGSATVDISEHQLTGFIDFREPGSEGDRELIATLLMEELDKEKEYETINLSMMHKNRVIEEVLFETENVH